MAWMLVRKAAHIDGGLPSALQSQMYFNIGIDFAVGLLPFVGDLWDAMYRANSRNAWLLEVYLKEKAAAEREHLEQNLILNPAVPAKPAPTSWMPSFRGGLLGGGKSRKPDEEMAIDHSRPRASKGGGPANE
jgi:hypothetical protein